MSKSVTVVHYWVGCPKSPNSKWQRFLAIVQRCAQEGWKNYLVWSRMPENPAIVESFKDAGCKIILQPRSRGNFDLGSVWRTYRLLRTLKCDIFHCHNDHTSPLIGATLARVPVRIWSKLAMSPYYEKGDRPRGLHRLMPSARVSCLCAHRILAISDKVGYELIETIGFGNKIDTVYVPVDYQRFAHAADGNIRQEMGFNRSHIIITSVGHAVPVKGWDVAIKAFIHVHQVIPNARLVLIGDRTSLEYSNQLTEMIKQYEMEENIKFTGKRDDIPEILKTSDIFILPSRSDGLCLALIEALAAGLPCVASRVGGVPEVITHGKDGLLFERENSQELAESLIKLIENQTLRTKLASKASSRAREFNMEAYVDRVFECYQTLTANHTTGGRPILVTHSPNTIESVKRDHPRNI